jgi:hypothetical protein
VKKEQNGRKSLRRLKPTVGCNASKRRRRLTVFTKGEETCVPQIPKISQ